MSESRFTFMINGKEYPAVSGQKILEVAREEDIFVPGVCYHPDLGTIQTCDTCYVRWVVNWFGLAHKKAVPGMEVDTLSK